MCKLESTAFLRPMERLIRFFHSRIEDPLILRSNRAKVSKAESDNNTREIKKGKGKQRQVEGNVEEEVRFAIIVEHAECLRNNMPDLLVPLTRLAELLCITSPRELIMLTSNRL
jgi:hypothetical protein